MEKLFLAMWVYDGLKNLLIFTGTIGLFIGIFLLIFSSIELDAGYYPKKRDELGEEIELGEKVKKIGIKLASVGLISFGLLCFMPSKTLFYSYVGYKAMNELKVLDGVGGIGKKVVKVLNKKLDEMLDDTKESK